MQPQRDFFVPPLTERLVIPTRERSEQRRACLERSLRESAFCPCWGSNRVLSLALNLRGFANDQRRTTIDRSTESETAPSSTAATGAYKECQTPALFRETWPARRAAHSRSIPTLLRRSYPDPG